MFSHYEFELVVNKKIPQVGRDTNGTFPTFAQLEVKEVYDDHSFTVASIPVELVTISHSKDADYFKIIGYSDNQNEPKRKGQRKGRHERGQV